MAEQIPFALPVSTSFDSADFLESACNEAALEAIERWPFWPDPVLILIGPSGAGKSHLARIWAAKSGAAILSAIDPAVHNDRLDGSPLVIEDADGGFGNEQTVFHRVHAARVEKADLLITARLPVAAWGIKTPDLLSRLRLAPVVTIAPPDDAFLRALLVKLFVDRQLALNTAVVEYLVPRIERSYAAAAQVVDRIDHLSLARKTKPSRALAAEVLTALFNP